MATLITASIDLTKIDKSKIKDHSNGSKYYPITIYINDEVDKFGNNVSIKTSTTKEERDGGDKGTYIGNGKVYDKGAKPKAKTTANASEPTDDLPF